MASLRLQRKVVAILKVSQFLVSAKCKVHWERLSEQMGGTWSILSLDEVRQLEIDGWTAESVERLWELSGLVQSVINLFEVPPYVLNQALRRVRLDIDRMMRPIPSQGNHTGHPQPGLEELRKYVGAPSRSEQLVIDVVREHGCINSQKQILDLLGKRASQDWLSEGTVKKACADLKRRSILATPSSGKGYVLGPLAGKAS